MDQPAYENAFFSEDRPHGGYNTVIFSRGRTSDVFAKPKLCPMGLKLHSDLYHVQGRGGYAL